MDFWTPERKLASPEDGTATPEDGAATPEDGTATAEDRTATAEDEGFFFKNVVFTRAGMAAKRNKMWYRPKEHLQENT